MVTSFLMLIMATAAPAAMGSSHGKPHIIFIFADDMIATPNLDALAADGVVLSNHYAQSVCTPSRAALLTGLYPARFGLERNLFYPSAPGGLPLDVTLVPEHLGRLGYRTNIVGKNGSCGYDFWFNEQLLTDAYGVYSMDIFLNRAKTIIRNHNASEPRILPGEWRLHGAGIFARILATGLLLDNRKVYNILLNHISLLLHVQRLFRFFSMQAPHIGTGGSLFRPPEEHVRKFLYIGDTHRIGYAATLDTMYQATGAVVEALYEKGMLENSVVIFSSDNGPDPIGMGSSWPLRGSKWTPWEGGVRVAAFIWSPLLGRSGAESRVSSDLVHMVDWMPTLYQAAGGNTEDLGNIDGFSQWGTLCRGEPPARQELLHGFNPTDGSGAYRSGRYKLVVAPSDGSWKDGRFRPAGNISSDVDVDQLKADSTAAKTLAKLYSANTTRAPSHHWRRKAAVSCRHIEPCKFRASDSPYLFDVVDDPCELRNLATERSDLVESIMKKLVAAASITVPPGQSRPNPEAYP